MAKSPNNTFGPGNLPPSPPDLSTFLDPGMLTSNNPQPVPPGSGAPAGSGGAAGTRSPGKQNFPDSAGTDRAIRNKPMRNA